MTKRLLLLIFVCLLGQTGFSQLSSIEIIPSLVSSAQSETGSSFAFEITANDVGLIGAMSIVVYEQETENPVMVMELSANEIASRGLIQDGKIIFQGGEAFPDRHYTITADLQNLQMAYLSQITVQYP